MDKQLLVDTFGPKVESWSIDESSDDVSQVDGINILGRVSGPFFVTNASTENNRFYPKSLWENAISKKTDLISSGLMFGTIGHKQSLDDQAILEGKASHRVSKLWIDEDGRGFGEVLILNTPSGRVLNTIIRSGAKFPVSSRGYGEYKGKTSEGKRIVNPDTFDLVGFDFVRVPGVTTAIPQLVEDSNDDDLIANNGEEFGEMSADLVKVIESLTDEKAQLRIKIDEILDTNRQLTEKLARMEETNSGETINTLRDALHEAEKIAIEYRMLGTPDEISEVFSTVESNIHKAKYINESASELSAELMEELNSYRECGTVDEVNTSINGAINMLSAYEKLGSPTDIEEAITESESFIKQYKELGSPSDIERALNMLEEFSTEVGSLDDTITALDKSASLLEQYIALGSPEEITQAFNLIESHLNEAKEQEFNTMVEEISEDLGVHREVVASMIKTHGKEQGIEMIKTIRESNGITTRYRKTSITEDFVPVNEDRANKTVMNESRSARLLDTFSR